VGSPLGPQGGDDQNILRCIFEAWHIAVENMPVAVERKEEKEDNQ